jgi:hypothetical protein|tara:strand:- start:3324 stop:3725 length:402 start_codon:yes stop_codon:yes gene_type:complete
MDLEYALITSSSLPDQVRESQYYATLNKEQFLDLVDYSEVLVSEDKSQKVLLLMVAKGTKDQEDEDVRRSDEADLALKRTADLRSETLSKAEAEAELLAQEKLLRDSLKAEEDTRKKSLRDRSRSIVNGLYNR